MMDSSKALRLFQEIGLKTDERYESSTRTILRGEINHALRRQIPTAIAREYSDGTGVCRICGNTIYIDEYCSKCGQRLGKAGEINGKSK